MPMYNNSAQILQNIVKSDAFISAVAGETYANYTSRADDKIIGVLNPQLITNPTALTQDVDFTTYGDRAVLTITNNIGSSVKWTGASIRGRPIIQRSGNNGYRWDYSDYTDIERNGEKAAEIGNDYIFDTAQVEAIGDYWTKELRPHYCYSLVYPGCLYNIQRGDVWHLTLSYTTPEGVSEAELIDTDVEIIGTEMKKTVGGIGETIIDCRVPSDAWTKTTSRRARLINAGRAQYLRNRSNVITVASSTWTEQADYFCDGTADENEIQQAIDLMSGRGGGEVVLTAGTFTIAATLTMKDNVWIHGTGTGTIISPWASTVGGIIDFSTAVMSKASSLVIDGVKATITHTTSGVKVIACNTACECDSVLVQNYKFRCNSGTATFYCIYGGNISLCSISGIELYNAGTMSFNGYHSCVSMASCSMDNVIETYGGVVIYGHNACNNLVSCSSHNNATQSANANVYSFYNCKNMSSCSSYSNSGNGSSAIIYGFASCQNIASCSDYLNSLSGASALIYSFRSCYNVSASSSYTNSVYASGAYVTGFSNCNKITLCNTSSNTSALASTYGFIGCRSVQQCASSGDSIAYGTSYADSGTTNSCQDTAAGGYNS